MTRVEWSRRTADEIETVLGVTLCRENPAATRRRPSRGDGGIDVYVPNHGRWTVYQIKSYTGSLDRSRKRHITQSWLTFKALVDSRKLAIDAWYLLRPENPTAEDDAWLAKLTQGAEFPYHWQGLDHCDRLAADNQSVVDYYLYDGKQRLAVAIEDLLAVTGAKTDILDEPGRSQDTLFAVHRAMNLVDPHFRYDFSVTTLSLQADGTPIMPALPLT